MTKFNVMHLRCAIRAGGGPEKTIFTSPQFINKNEFNMIIVYIRKMTDKTFLIGDKVKDFDIIYHEVEDRIQIDIKSLLAIRKLLYSYKIDILHSHGFKSDFYAWFLRKTYRVKLVTTAHGWNPTTLRERLFFSFDKMILRYFDSIVVVNERQKDHLISKGIPKEKIIVVHNAIDTNKFRTNPARISRSPTIDFCKDSFVIGYIGRLSQEKGVDKLINSVFLLTNNHKNIRLFIIGDGPERSSLEAYSKKLGLQEYVVFIGYIKDIENIYMNLDLLVLPSLTEGLPNVVLEALSFGVPVVATNVGGLPEIIKSGSNGLLVDPGDVIAISEAIGTLILNDNLREKFILEGRKTVCDKYSFKQRMKKIENVYREVMKS